MLTLEVAADPTASLSKALLQAPALINKFIDSGYDAIVVMDKSVKSFTYRFHHHHRFQSLSYARSL